MTDQISILERLRSLDPEVISSIHNQYYSEVYSYALYRVGDKITAEDIASEVFTRMLEAVSEGSGPRESLRGWLMGTTSNMVNDHFRRSYAQPVSELHDHIESPAKNMTPRLELQDQRRVLRSAMKQLTTAQQHVIALRFGNDFSLKETARVMGKNVNAIKALQFRALNALREKLGEEEL